MLEARGDGSWLYLSGKLKDDPDNSFDDYVEVANFGGFSVTYNQESVPISGSYGTITNIDARELKGVGVNVYLLSSNESQSALLTKEDDFYAGGNGRDVTKGRGGDDYLYGGSGDDRLIGQSGNDSLYGSHGDDLLKGGGGDDFLSGSVGADKLKAGSGNDTLYSGDDDDRLWAGPGDDVFSGGNGRDIAFYDGNAADYEITLVDGNYQIVDLRDGSPEGTDTFAYVEVLRFADQKIAMAPLSSELTVGISGETLYVGGTAARSDPDALVRINVSGLTVQDNNIVPLDVPVPEYDGYLSTVNAQDVENAGVFAYNVYEGYLSQQGDYFSGSVAYGYGGNDTLQGDSYGDWLYGGTGDDLIIGDSYTPFYDSTDAGDTLLGGQGNDTLDGYVGDDTLIGGDGDDQLWGGPGDDYIHGGDGYDVAVFWGDESDYVITEENGVMTVAWADGIPGTDTLIQVEELLFVPFGSTASAGGPAAEARELAEALLDGPTADPVPGADTFALDMTGGPAISSMLPQPIETHMPAEIAAPELMIP